jgi:hypothetical protein
LGNVLFNPHLLQALSDSSFKSLDGNDLPVAYFPDR